jgi:hypothetical protein
MEDEYVVWITTRKLKPGTHEEFIQAWKPREFPEGMIREYECCAADRQEVVGLSVWDSLELRERSDSRSPRVRRDVQWLPSLSTKPRASTSAASSGSQRELKVAEANPGTYARKLKLLWAELAIGPARLAQFCWSDA